MDRSFVVATALAATGLFVVPAPVAKAAPDARADACRTYGLDPGSPLASRVRTSAPELRKLFSEATAQPMPYTLSAAEHRQVAAALEALPPLHRRILKERMRGLYFYEGIWQRGMVIQLEPDARYPLFDIAIGARVLRQSLSELATSDARRKFDQAGSTAWVSIEAGPVQALLFVLLHESTHVVGRMLSLLPRSAQAGLNVAGGAATPFTAGIWIDYKTHDPAIGHGALDAIRRIAPERAPMAHAADVYAALSGTPFASLDGSASWFDDLADLVSWHHVTEKLGHRYRITIRDGDRTIFSYEPMHSPLVRARFAQLARFYEAAAAAQSPSRSPSPRRVK